MDKAIEITDAAAEPVETPADPNLLLKLVDTLKGVPAADRSRYVYAALVFLGTPLEATAPFTTPSRRDTGSTPTDTGPLTSTFPRRVSVWMNQNALDQGTLDTVFHVGPNGVEVIAHTVPGKSNRERVRCCYLLAGVRSFLESGEPRFTDESGRAICRDLGCYDQANHSTYVKQLGNLIAGSKSSSFELTQPGLKAAAELIRELRGAVA